jgi:hypothetical protein
MEKSNPVKTPSSSSSSSSNTNNNNNNNNNNGSDDSVETKNTTETTMLGADLVRDIDAAETATGTRRRKPSWIDLSDLEKIKDAGIADTFRTFARRFGIFIGRATSPTSSGHPHSYRAHFGNHTAPKVTCTYTESDRTATGRMTLKWNGERDGGLRPIADLESLATVFYHLCHYRRSEDEAHATEPSMPDVFVISRQHDKAFQRIRVSGLIGNILEKHRGLRLPTHSGDTTTSNAFPSYILILSMVQRRVAKRPRSYTIIHSLSSSSSSSSSTTTGDSDIIMPKKKRLRTINTSGSDVIPVFYQPSTNRGNSTDRIRW